VALLHKETYNLRHPIHLHNLNAESSDHHPKKIAHVNYPREICSHRITPKFYHKKIAHVQDDMKFHQVLLRPVHITLKPKSNSQTQDLTLKPKSTRLPWNQNPYYSENKPHFSNTRSVFDMCTPERICSHQRMHAFRVILECMRSLVRANPFQVYKSLPSYLGSWRIAPQNKISDDVA